MYEKEIREIEEEAIRELWKIPKPSAVKQIKRLIRRYVLRQLVEPIDLINWPKGCLLLGIVKGDRLAEAEKYFDMWMQKKCPVYTVDDCLAGQALLYLYEKTETMDARYLRAAEQIMTFLYRHETDALGSLPYRPAHKTYHIYADGVGMISPFAIHYGILAKDEKAIELGIRQIINFMDFGMHEETALPYHLYCYHSGEKRADQVWGRAAGWLLYGIGMSISLLRQAGREKEVSIISERTKDFLDRVKTCADQNGLYHSVLTDLNSPVDTSATAMICLGLQAFFEKTVDPKLLVPFVENGKVMQAQGECIGIGVYSENYGSYPWSVGMGLLLFET